MQEDKKKKIKAMLYKLLVFLVILGISIATYKVNLSQMLHDFVMRFYYAGMGQKTEASVLPENYSTECCLRNEVYGLMNETDVKITHEQIQSLCDDISELDNISEGTYVKEWILGYKEIREASNLQVLSYEQIKEKNYNFSETLCEKEAQRSLNLNEQFKESGITPENAWCFYEIENIDNVSNSSCVKINMYEWTFVEYTMNGCSDIMGYGVNHVLFAADNNITDIYLDDFCSGKESDTVSSARITQYDVDAAINYSDKYAVSYNPSYSNYNSIGGDCANYVSQCLFAGGIPMTDGWYWKSYDERSASWSYCPAQVEYFTKTGAALIENPSDAQVVKGNPVYYYSATSGRYSHAAICVGKNSADVPVVNAHNYDRYHVPWELGSKWTMRSTILITKIPDDTIKPVISDVSVSDITNQGFYITMKVRDNVGVSKVLIPVWTAENGQDDIIWHTATVKNGTAGCYVNASSHGYEGGTYLINIYAYDAAGNVAWSDCTPVNIDRSVPAGTKKGDATLDGKVDLRDSGYILRISLGISKISDISAADYNNDGVVNLNDAKLVLRIALGIAV